MIRFCRPSLPIQGEKAFLTILGSRYISAGQVIYLGSRNRLKQKEELDRFLTFFPPPLCSSINHEGNPNYALHVHYRRDSNMDLNQPNPSPPQWSSIVPSTYARGLEELKTPCVQQTGLAEPITTTRGNKLTMGTLKLPIANQHKTIINHYRPLSCTKIISVLNWAM